MSVFGTGQVVERGPTACPSCRAPWPRKAGHMRVGTEHCHGCPGARYGVHRTWTCLTCGIEHFDEACERLGGDRTRQALTPSTHRP